ncbi:MAG: amidase [Cytophagales bacterium]|jgi:Asp-tRNA(Asn)/Glu-tRNA(Gln) amidotransferase A subunit family amidase|nr:amidase [Cytophagales bacterium]MCA6388324.1 amidase [Cytophagales bacterium]MCA6392333.1 amidase [Cytophagales bacterium]MCA6394275.1 amidase [Cytophagales bacterium]MCA6398568.1 amidase [Cytophagales bacterium]
MKNATPIVLALITFLLVQCASPTKINRGDVQSAEKLLGIEFSKGEIDTMLTYLSGNRKGYDSMRKVKLKITTKPAIYFDPRPDYFVPKARAGQSDWKLVKEVSLPETDTKIAFLSVTELSALIRSGKITSTRLTQIYLDRLKKYKDTLLAVVTITEELALKQAAKADLEIKQGIDRGVLHGIPYGIKDLFSIPGYKTTWGAEPYQNQVIDETAAVIKRLEEAGAILVAKLTSGALARGDVWFGGKTKNPWDFKQGASGSSAGSASATSAGLVAFAIGTETLGSIIAPSARCGVTGLRPTFGAVSRAGCMTLSWSMDKAGPIGRSAQDCAIIFNAIKGKNNSEQDRSVVDYPFSFNPPLTLKGYKIGYFKKLFDKKDTSKVKVNDSISLEKFRELGAVLEEVKMPDSIPFDAFDIILRAEAGASFDDLVREHRDRLLSEQTKESRANSLRQSRFISAVEYLQANRHRTVLIEKFNAMIKGFDFILSPTNGKDVSLATNLTGHPAITIPNGFDKKGRPTSITLIGNLYDEGPLLEAAYLFQQATDFEEKHPARFTKSK